MDMTSWLREYETLEVSAPEAGIAVLRLNRPERYNAMTDTMFAELEAFARAFDDDPANRALILTGAGKGFCSGYDLADADRIPEAGPLGMLAQQERAARALSAIRGLRVPVIAAVNGPAAGGGFSLALVADIRLASTAARFNAAFVRIGLSAGDLGASWILTRLIGPARTSEICFTGRFVEVEEAREIGLVNAVSAPEDLLEDALALARTIRGNSPGGIQLSKRALQANMEASSYAAAIELENRGQALLSRSADMAEALAAFKEKRTPTFIGN